MQDIIRRWHLLNGTLVKAPIEARSRALWALMKVSLARNPLRTLDRKVPTKTSLRPREDKK